MADKEQVRPLAAASPTVHDEEAVAAAAGGWRSRQYLRKRRCALWCCGCCGAIVIILGVVILVLALTVFKVKDPVLTLNAIYVEGFDAGVGTITNPLSVNATFIADVSIKNPNAASFRYDNSTTEFYYEGQTVAVAYAPDGSVAAGRTVQMNVTLDVFADRVAEERNVTQSLLNGAEVNLTSYTDLSGRVNVMGIYKRNIEVMLNCSMTLELPQFSSPVIKNKVCQANVS